MSFNHVKDVAFSELSALFMDFAIRCFNRLFSARLTNWQRINMEHLASVCCADFHRGRQRFVRISHTISK